MKRLSRIELLELLIASEKDNEILREQLEEKTLLLEDKHLMIENAGSLAEACIEINDVVNSVQAAADQYLDNIKSLNPEKDEQAGDVLQNAREEAEKLLAETRHKCAEQEALTEKKVEETWASLRQRLEDFYDAHSGLREMVAASNFTLKL